MRTGRPRKLQSVKEVDKKISDYWQEVKGEKDNPEKMPQAPTLTGLALALGYCDLSSFKQSLENMSNELTPSIKKAVTKIERYYEHCLTIRPQCTGAIFWLKNRGWKDIQEVKVNDEQAKAITESQREVARQLVERHILTTSLPSVQSSVIDSIKAYPEERTLIVGQRSESDIGRAEISTEFTSDNTVVTPDK